MLRLATERDVAQMLAIYAPYILHTAYSFEYTVPTQEAFAERFRRITARFPWLVWEENGNILGYAYGSAPFTREEYAWCAEASIYLKPEAHAHGIGRRLYTALETLLKMQGYQLLYALITTENEGSLRFHDRLGYFMRAEFPRCGYKFGRWVGVVWMEKQLDIVDFPENMPKAFPRLHENVQNMDDILWNLSLS